MCVCVRACARALELLLPKLQSCKKLMKVEKLLKCCMITPNYWFCYNFIGAFWSMCQHQAKTPLNGASTNSSSQPVEVNNNTRLNNK